jgi:hypothetical protein
MTAMMIDGAQYDVVGPWDQDTLLHTLEAELTKLDAAETDEARAFLRASVIAINEDLKALHGIDLGPF